MTDRIAAALERARNREACNYGGDEQVPGREMAAALDVIEAAQHTNRCGCGTCFYCVLHARLLTWADAVLGDSP